MQVLDSPARYGAVSRIFHWGIAALLMWQLFGMVSKVTLGRDAALTGFLAGHHGSLGFVLFVLIVLRVVWALVNIGRRPAHDGGVLGTAAKAGHLALYALMMLIPGIALIRAWGGERAYEVFGWPLFAARPEGQAVEWAVKLGGDWHGELGWVLALLILGHVVMALWHGAVKGDGTLDRMAGSAS